MRKIYMTRLKRAIGVCTLASALFQTAAVYAATYYVATTGSNSNPGTEKQPWQTVAHAVNTMVAGDTTYVRGGTYNEGVMLFRRSGTQSAQIKLLNYLDEAPIIHCNTSSPRGPFNRITIANRSGVNVAIGWITIEGFEIRNCWDGLKIHSGHDLTIRRNWIHDNFPGQGILGTGTRILIDRNVINHNGGFAVCATTPSQCNQDHGIYASGTAYTITNNLIYDNLAYGIQVAGAYTYAAAKYAGPEYVDSADWIIANNTIAYQVHRAAIVVWGSAKNLQIVNNIFYENGRTLASSAPQGIDFVSADSNSRVTIDNNLAYASGAGASAFLSIFAIEGIHYTQSGNIVNAVNPAFVNASATPPASPNFTLTERSPAIDKGLSLTVTKTAFDGTTRPQGGTYDIGAYEYKAGGDITPPVAPSSTPSSLKIPKTEAAPQAQ
jgi:Right handed beta helix region